MKEPDGRSDKFAADEEQGSQADLVQVKVEDDGVGLAPDIDISQVHSMGFNLVNLLVQQLRGNLEIGRDSGLAVAVSFSPR